jgi:hypothetical protein
VKVKMLLRISVVNFISNKLHTTDFWYHWLFIKNSWGIRENTVLNLCALMVDVNSVVTFLVFKLRSSLDGTKCTLLR